MHRSLLIAPIYAASLMTGGGQRTFHISQALARLGEVDLMLVSEPAFAHLEAARGLLEAAYPHVRDIVVHRSTEQFFLAPGDRAGRLAKMAYLMQRVVRTVRPQAHFFRPTSRARQDLLRLMQRRNYSVLVGRYLKITALAGAFDQSTTPVLVDLDDLEDRLLAARIETARSRWERALLRFQYGQVDSILRRLRSRCAHLFTASDEDRELIGGQRCSVLPNIPMADDTGLPAESSPPVAQEPTVLFVGSHGHGANRDGVLAFVQRSWPAVRRAVPQARFRIVGSGGWESWRDDMERTSGVDVVGAVDDLAPEYARATLAVVPIDQGSGTKIKVLEALLHGRPVVASEHSARGYRKLVGRGLVTASGAEEMAARCSELLCDPAACRPLVESGRAIVRERYSAQAVFQAVNAALPAVTSA